jgi:hypothetical protein
VAADIEAMAFAMAPVAQHDILRVELDWHSVHALPLIESRFAMREPNPRVISIQATCYRFHKARHFSKLRDHFFRIFIDTRAKFEARARFAPAFAHCGHYFANSEKIASAEALFYSDVKGWNSVNKLELVDVMAMLRRKYDEEFVFLAVHLEVDNIVDFTAWESVDEFMRYGSLQRRGVPCEFAVQYLAGLISEDRGGNELTDILGVDVRRRGYNGVIFPSTRIMLFESDLPAAIRIRQNLEAIKRMSAAGGIMDLEWQGAEQLRADWNLVVFSGVLLTRSVSGLEWLDEKGNTGSITNPYFGATDDALELARLRYRANRGIDPETAAIEGLLTSDEAEEEFYDRTVILRP